LITVFLITFGITAIGIGLGALYPNFNYENAAEIPTSFGGAIAMILSVAFIAVAVIIEAWPVYQLTIASLRYARIAAPTAGVLAPALIAVGVLTAAVVIVSLRVGIKRLEQLRD
jgi:ABC-2 type transport system permease protein